jgi:hypothetical protein
MTSIESIDCASFCTDHPTWPLDPVSSSFISSGR